MRRLLAAAAAFVSWAAAAPGAERPHVLLIMVDDMGFSDLGCYGGEIETPHLDSLAAGGLRFTQFYNTGRCWPTRASLMTGLYPHEAGHAGMEGPDAPPAYRGTRREAAPFVSELLSEQGGYRAWHVGKWHLNSRGDGAAGTWPLQRGFERSYLVKRQDNFFNPVEIEDDGATVRRPGDADPDYYVTDAFTDRAIALVEEHAASGDERPFFLYLAHTAPHFPLHARPEDIARYRGRYRIGWDAVRQARHARLVEMGIVDTALSPRDPAAAPWESLDADAREMWDGRMACHAAMIHRVDQGVGRLVRRLEELGLLQDTLILFLSDNGASAEYIVRGDGHDPEAPLGSGATYTCLEVGWSNASNSPFREHKIWVHEGGIATPLIAHWPAGIAARGELVHQPAHVIDLAPALLELAGVPEPEKMSGKSLAPLLRGEEAERHEALYWEHEGNRAARQGDWKLVAPFGGAWELYDLSRDRAESRDLASEMPEQAAALAALWQAWADRVGVVLPDAQRQHSPEYRMK